MLLFQSVVLNSNEIDGFKLKKIIIIVPTCGST